MTPDAILAAVAEVYSTTPTYRDTGVVLTRTLTPDGRLQFTSEQPFETAFVRPGQFRFESRSRFRAGDHWNRYVVWTDGSDVRTWWDVTHRAETPESLDLAVAGATGVSGGAAHTVPALLVPDAIGGRRLAAPIEVAELPDDGGGGAACHQLTARYTTDGAPLTLWVDRVTFLIRRTERTARSDTSRTHAVTTYDPEAGGEVPVDELRFGAPDPDLE